ncbi:MAG TPA: RagB/SusD family nutrient uptake outer membrane protein [Longimicrobiaceae bacterium]
MPTLMFTTRKRVALGVVVPVACALVLARCDGLLDTQPFGSLNTGTFYKTAGDFEAATIGAYSTLQNLTYSGRDQSIFEQMLLPDDDTRAPGSDEDSDFSWTPTNNSIGYIWDVSYRGILRANLILQQLELTDQLTPEEIARFSGEAKFVRAYFNFILARMFGTPPVVTQVASSIEETRLANSQPGEIWDLIEADLEDAITGLAGLDLEDGRASEWAARALLGKVELYRAQWFNQPEKYAEAEQHLQEVVNSGQFSLVPYKDNFDYRTENNAESLFELQASFGTDINGWAATDENGGGASAGTGRPLATGAGGFNGVNAPGGFDWGDGGIIMTRTFVDFFERYDSATVTVPGTGQQVKVVVRDPRAYWTFYSTGEQYGRACDGQQPVPYNFVWGCQGANVNATEAASWSVTGHTPAKYIRPYENYAGGQMLNQSVSQNNERLIRYADVLLLLAEAKILGSGDLAGAAALINQVRARARDAWDSAYGAASADADLYASFTKPANLLPDVVPVSQEQMFEALMYERRAELSLEFSRFADLVRWLRAGLIDRSDIDFGDDTANSRFNPEVHLLRPIPLGEMDLNPNLQQNPGY